LSLQRVNRINERFPRFYRTWDKDSVFFTVINAFAKIIDDQQKDLFVILRSHWVDTASIAELDSLGSLFLLKRLDDENDESFRQRIKSFITSYKGGGTVESIEAGVNSLLGVGTDKIVLIENPPTQSKFEEIVEVGKPWALQSASINDEYAKITISITGKDLEVDNPTLTNQTLKSSITFNGKLKYGQKLTIAGTKADLDGMDVSDKMIFTNHFSAGPKISRKFSSWVYSESLSSLVGHFDDAVFDKSIFELPIPSLAVKIEWTAHALATFELRVPSYALTKKGISKEKLEETVNAIKAAGVKAIVTVVD
jgi:hypothetical protein